MKKNKVTVIMVLNTNTGYRVIIGDRILYVIDDDIEGVVRSWSCTKELINKLNGLKLTTGDVEHLRQA